MNWLNNLKIQSKLQLVLGVLIIGFLVIASMFYYLRVTNEQAFANEEQSTEFSLLTLKVEELMQRAERSDSDFLLDKKLEHVTQHEEYIVEVNSTLERMLQIALSEEETKIINKSKILIQEYQDKFHEVIDHAKEIGLNEKSGFLGELIAEAHDVENLLLKEQEPALTASLLSMRRFEKDYITREDPVYISRMSDEQKKFNRLLAASNISVSLKNEISESMNIYQKGFSLLTKSSQEYRESIINYREIIKKLEPELALLEKITVETAARHHDEVVADRAFAEAVFVIALFVTSIIVTTLLIFVVRTIRQAFQRFQEIIGEVAGGSSDVRLGLKTKDELGELAQSFDNILDERQAYTELAEKENEKLNDSIIRLLEGVSDLSNRDLTSKVNVAEDVTGPVADAMNMMASETARVLKNIRSVAEEVENVASEVNMQGTHVSGVATKEREIVQITLEKLEEATATMSEISKLAQTCNEIATNASISTSEALKSVTNTTEGMNDIRETISETEKRIKRLGERSQEITGVVEIINNIAERTHVLALNASMQAAAAGDAGRGFAVVADEVQRLAESSRQSTAEIQALVSNIQTETAETMATMNKTISQVVDGTELAKRSGEQMVATQKTTHRLATAVEKIASRSLKQAEVSQLVHKQATEIVESTNETSKALKDQSEHTNNLVDFSKRLVESVQVFKLPA